jgi:hypothetical protein
MSRRSEREKSKEEREDKKGRILSPQRPSLRLSAKYVARVSSASEGGGYECRRSR